MPTTALQFSGGKDSTACLYLLQPHWDDILVVWMNAGAPLPEMVELMERIKNTVPHFLEVKSNVLSDIARNGLPVDLVPVESTTLGKFGAGTKGPLMRSWIECCSANLWAPLHQEMQRLGITKIIRGQRKEELLKSLLKNGSVVNGVEYWYPIEDWSEAEVFSYLREKGVELPDSYQHMKTGTDCWCCTAHLPYLEGMGRFLKEKHPALYAARKEKIAKLYSAIDSEHARVKGFVAKELELEVN
jgi:3'-phosphoadenosine 5'-phosphosulfate sulfotransferase (PAPS reductase)/FAD synthetase